MEKQFRLPPIGNRIIKSAVGVLLCWCVYLLRGRSGIPFYSMLAVLWCIQPYINKTLTMALQRTVGTLIGAAFGLVTIVLEIYVFDNYDKPLGFLIVALMIVPVIYTTLLIKRQNASYFSCVVFLSITVNHITDDNPYLFVLNRVLDTFIGIAIGMLVNSARLPRRRVKDVLFTAELDDMLSPISEQLTPFSKIEINRMLSEGLKFTLSTMRTPASLMGILSDVDLNLPVVVMNGAALYDFRENSYVKAYIISWESCENVREIVRAAGMNVFTNALCDESLVIYYDKLENEAEQKIFASLKKSPYRNYLHRQPQPEDGVIYLMIVDRSEKISALYDQLSRSETGQLLKLMTYPSQDYPGYSYIKIYNKNAGKQHMTEILCREYGIEKCETVTANGSRSLNGIAHRLKNSFEPLVFKK
ncbi:MAG: aromatic acid exporter family protein [Oscillospiraceae bacterium]